MPGTRKREGRTSWHQSVSEKSDCPSLARQAHGVQLGKVTVVPSRSAPKTTSGKIARKWCAKALRQRLSKAVSIFKSGLSIPSVDNGTRLYGTIRKEGSVFFLGKPQSLSSSVSIILSPQPRLTQNSKGLESMNKRRAQALADPTRGLAELAYFSFFFFYTRSRKERVCENSTASRPPRSTSGARTANRRSLRPATSNDRPRSSQFRTVF